MSATDQSLTPDGDLFQLAAFALGQPIQLAVLLEQLQNKRHCRASWAADTETCCNGVPTVDGRWLIMPRHTQPEKDMLLQKLQIELPAQPPPRITSLSFCSEPITSTVR